ncbi:hypothetical protein T265_15165, partial [Opisthorchis viverrini]
MNATRLDYVHGHSPQLTCQFRLSETVPTTDLGQPGSIPDLVQPSVGMTVRHQKGATAERFLLSSVVINRVVYAK